MTVSPRFLVSILVLSACGGSASHSTPVPRQVESPRAATVVAPARFTLFEEGAPGLRIYQGGRVEVAATHGEPQKAPATTWHEIFVLTHGAVQIGKIEIGHLDATGTFLANDGSLPFSIEGSTVRAGSDTVSIDERGVVTSSKPWKRAMRVEGIASEEDRREVLLAVAATFVLMPALRKAADGSVEVPRCVAAGGHCMAPWEMPSCKSIDQAADTGCSSRCCFR